MFEVVYLTGAPAAGKSTTAKLLAQRVSPLEIFEFGERLASYLTQKSGGSVAQEDLRRYSAGLVTSEDVQAVDHLLLNFVTEARSRTHLIIDSHPVTKESFGYRVTPFVLDDFALLSPTQIWVLYANPETTVARIGRDAKGRPMVTPDEAVLHTHLQASVAIAYGMHTGTPVHLFDTSRLSSDKVAEMLSHRFKTNPFIAVTEAKDGRHSDSETSCAKGSEGIA